MIIKAGTTPVTHFTVIKNTKEGIKQQLETVSGRGCRPYAGTARRYSAWRDHDLW